MNTKIKIIYLTISVILITAGCSIAFMFWWTYMDIDIYLIFSAWLTWLGCLYLGLLISRLIIVKNDDFKFIGLMDVTDNNYYKDEIGEVNAKKIKQYITLISFGTFFILCTIFSRSAKLYEKFQLNNYGIKQSAIIKDAKSKNGRRAYFEYSYNNKNYSNALYKESFNIGDTISIKFSTSRPDIVVLLEGSSDRQ